jgi:hypothetical protein
METAMLFTKEVQKKGAQRRAIRLHSVAALLKERRFEGSFELNGLKHTLVYAPARAEAQGGKLRLQGRLSITNPRGRERSRDGVGAIMASSQGGIGGAPPRRQVEGFNMPGEFAQTTSGVLPVTDSTGPFSFCGVMYFHFEPLDGRAFGVGADLSRVQLNARLAPTDDVARDLQGLYSSAIDALYGEKASERAATAFIGEINRVLGAA